jgi:hypothetical protein
VSVVGVKLMWSWRVINLSILLVIYAALTSCQPATAVAARDPSTPEPGLITVRITNTSPAVQTAIARVVESLETDTLDQGKLSFSSCLQGQRISVWSPGYYVYTLTCNGSSPIEYPVPLERMHGDDNPGYLWIDADIRSNPALNCASCHTNPSLGLNEYAEWSFDGHSMSLVSPYFRTTYMGTHISGSRGEKTEWGFAQDGNRFRLPHSPMSSIPDYGPGFQLDYPNETGNCAFCHAPATLVATQQQANLIDVINSSRGNRINVGTEGVTCDVCHKVNDVFLDEQKLPFVERPGVLSFSFVRPMVGTQHMLGPWSHWESTIPDIKQTCAPIFSESEFCAPCHYGKFSGVEIYASYKEWLNSPYSQPNPNYRSCQDCHMPSPVVIGNTQSVERDACSEMNLEFRDFSHNMMRYGPDPDNSTRTIPLMVKDAADVAIEQIFLGEGQVTFTVKVVNSGAGHKFPTDSPLRHLILWVEVKDANGNPLIQVTGPTIPKTGDSDYAGYPGEIYANLLKDKDTNSIPTIAYWNPVEPAWQNSDTRLNPGEEKRSDYSFAIPSTGSFVIRARLIYRNVFFDIAAKKGWPVIDIEAASITVPVVP